MSLFGQFPGSASAQPRNNMGPMSMASYGAPHQDPQQNFDEDDDSETFNYGSGSGADGGGRPSLLHGPNQFGGGQMNSCKDCISVKEENESIKYAIKELQSDRDKLRMAIRKLKVENTRMKAKMKRITDAMTTKRRPEGDSAMDADTANDPIQDALDDDVDFDEIGDFLLIGGPHDPLSVQYRCAIRDVAGTEHKSVERYLWYKMAETFNDQDAMNKILKAETNTLAEEIAKNIVNFDQKAWDAVKMKHWEDGQRTKLEQYREWKNLLVKTGKHYLAVASQDKVFGTGWRKQREEAFQPKIWDGENRGGKFLMKLRDEYSTAHTWATDAEEQEAQNAFYNYKRNTWKKQRDGGRNTSTSRGRGRGRGGNKSMPRNTNTNSGSRSAFQFTNVMDPRHVAAPAFYTGIANPNMGYPGFQNFGKRPLPNDGASRSSGRGSRGSGYDKRFRFE